MLNEEYGHPAGEQRSYRGRQSLPRTGGKNVHACDKKRIPKQYGSNGVLFRSFTDEGNARRAGRKRRNKIRDRDKKRREKKRAFRHAERPFEEGHGYPRECRNYDKYDD